MKKREVWERFKSALKAGRREEAAELYEQYLNLLSPEYRNLWFASLTVPEELPYAKTSLRPEIPMPFLEPKVYPRTKLPELLRKPEFFEWYRKEMEEIL